MVKHLPGEWQPADWAAYDALPSPLQDILKEGRTAVEMEGDLMFALSLYPEKKAAEYKARIIRCLGGTPK